MIVKIHACGPWCKSGRSPGPAAPWMSSPWGCEALTVRLSDIVSSMHTGQQLPDLPRQDLPSVQVVLCAHQMPNTALSKSAADKSGVVSYSKHIDGQVQATRVFRMHQADSSPTARPTASSSCAADHKGRSKTAASSGMPVLGKQEPMPAMSTYLGRPGPAQHTAPGP